MLTVWLAPTFCVNGHHRPANGLCVGILTSYQLMVGSLPWYSITCQKLPTGSGPTKSLLQPMGMPGPSCGPNGFGVNVIGTGSSRPMLPAQTSPLRVDARVGNIEARDRDYARRPVRECSAGGCRTGEQMLLRDDHWN